MKSRNYEIKSNLPLYLTKSIKDLKKDLTLCPKCSSKLIIQHIPNYKDSLMKEVIRCASCESKAIHQFHQVH